MEISKLEYSISVIQKAEEVALKYQNYGFHVAFSGGKDSQVVLELCKLAKVKYRAFFYKTSVDPPELLSHIRNNYPEVEWIRPRLTMFQLIEKKGMLPLRQSRFCCEYLKEGNGLNSLVITGLTKSESFRRSKRLEFEVSCKKGADKLLLNPILNWTVRDVIGFLKSHNIQMCSLYDCRQRIGCVGCPMSPKTMRLDFQRMPNFRKAYIFAVNKLMERGKYSEFDSADDVISWWASGQNRDSWLAIKKYQGVLF